MLCWSIGQWVQVQTCEFSHEAVLVTQFTPIFGVYLDRVSFLHGLVLFTEKSVLNLFEEWKPSVGKSLTRTNLMCPRRDHVCDQLCENKVLKPVSLPEVVCVSGSVKRCESSGQRHTTDSRITKPYPLRPHPSLQDLWFKPLEKNSIALLNN